MNTHTHTIATTSGSIASRGAASHGANASARMFRAAAVAGVALLALAGLPAAAVAQTTWSATPTSGLWNVGGNWAGGSAPTTGSALANSIVFATSNLTTTTNNFSSGTFHSITFNSGAPSYTLSGSAVTLTEGSATISTILNNSSSDQTITSLAITGPVNTELRSPNAWIILGTGGSVTGPASSNFQMGRNGPTRVKVDGGSISFAASIVMRGTGTSTLWVTSGTVTGTGAIMLGSNGNSATSVINLDGGVVQGGSLQLGDNSAARTGALGTVNQTGGTLRANNVFKSIGTTGTLAFNISGGTIAPFNNNMTFGSATSGSNADRITLTGNNGTISSIDRNDAARTVTIYTAIGDSGSNRGLTFSGSGGLIRLAATAANTYTGTTTVNSGTLQIGDSGTTGALSASSEITGASGGTLAFARTDNYGGNFGNPISGGLGLLLNSGTLTLTGNNSHTGGATISSGGRLVVGSATALGSSGALAVSGTLDLNGTSVGVGALSGAAGGVITTNATAGTATLTTSAASGTSTFAGVIQDNGSGIIALTKDGAGAVVFNGTNTFTGPTAVNDGTLQIGSSGTTGALSASTAITGSSGGTLAFARTDAYGGNFGNTISGGLGLLLRSGTLVLTGSNASYTGTTQVNGGVLTLSSASAIGSTGPVSFGGGTLQYTASNSADLSARIAGSGSAIAINTNSQSGTWASSLASSNLGGLSKSGAGTLTLSASNAFSGPVSVLGTPFVDNVLAVAHASALGNGTTVTVQGGALEIGSGITTGAGKTVTVQSVGGSSVDGGLRVRSGTGTWAGTVTMGGGRLGYTNANLVISGSVGGSGLTISGYGDGLTNTGSAFGVTLAGPAGYTGATSIIRGWLKIGADNMLPVGTTLDVFSLANSGAAQAATFDLNGFNQTVAGLTSTGNNGTTGFANGYVTNTGPAVRTLTVNQATTGTYGGLMTGNLAFTKSGAGNLTLMPIFVTTTGTNLFTSGTNTFTGETRVDAGTLTLSTATGNTSLALFGSTFDSSGAGTLSFGSMTAATFGGLKGPGNLTLENASAAAVALTVGGNDASTSFAGSLSGAGSIAKIGAGLLTFTGNNSYAGTTAVDAGGLLVDGANGGSGLVTVASAARLGGNGSLAGGLTLLSGAQFIFDPLATLDVTGAVTLANSFGVSSLANADGSAINWAGIADGTYTLINTTSTFGNISNFGASNAADIGGGRTAYFQNGSLQLVIVPEPGALALAGLGIAAAAWSRRRTHKKPGAEATG